MIDCMKDCKHAQCSAGCKHWQAELHTAKAENKRSGEDCIVRMQEARKQGYIAGLSRFAWWRLGVQYVGTSGTTLKHAIDEGE